VCRLVFTFALVVAASFPLHAQPPQDRNRPRVFDSLFAIRGVELTSEQNKQIQALRDQYVPQLSELQRQRASIMTAQQRRTWQQALRTAREAKQSPQQARESADVAAELSDQQRAEFAATTRQYTDLVDKIQAQVRGLLNARQRQQSSRGIRNTAQRVITRSEVDVKYGPHDRNVMDVWLADSAKPTPVLVSIHGGGFRGGNKGIDQNLLHAALQAGISVVAITYRLTDEAIAPAQFLDAARAIQFIRHHAKKWNFDPTRIAATGGSAGAGISLWLGFHDDLADPNNDDPVLRESTRLSGMAVYNGQTSYDPRVIRELFPDTDTYRHSALSMLFAIDFDQLDTLPEEKYRLFEQVSALPHVSKDDVPVLLLYASEMDTEITNQSIGIHHPRFATALKERMDALGIDCQIETGVRRGDGRYTELVLNFINRQFDDGPN
jgi:hypothetical protein